MLAGPPPQSSHVTRSLWFPMLLLLSWLIRQNWVALSMCHGRLSKKTVHSNKTISCPPPVRILTYVHLLPWFATCLTWPAKIRSPTHPAPESEAEPSKYRKSEACGRSATLRSGTGFGKSTTGNAVAHFCYFKNNLGASHGKFKLIGCLKQEVSPRPKTSSKWIMMPEIIKGLRRNIFKPISRLVHEWPHTVIGRSTGWYNPWKDFFSDLKWIGPNGIELILVG